VIHSPLDETVVFHLGPVPISHVVVTTWGLLAAVAALLAASTRRLAVRPGRWQACLELLVATLDGQIGEVLRRDPAPYRALLGSLFVFLALANSLSLLPGLQPPTAHFETAAALGAVVFLAVHVFGVRARGLGGYLKSYLEPTPVMLPLNVLAEVTRTFSLMVRLFGNIMSGEFVLGIVVALAGLLVPLPLMALGALTGLVQAYIFTTLATVFIGAAVGSIEKG
jgi:F-type H+-transporting ATPase subunit a